MKLARELTETCWGMYKYMATGLAAEITYFEIDSEPPAYGNPRQGPADFDPSPEAEWRKDFTVKSGDVHNLQRPETVESLFYMWRITNDNRYREWGWEMFKSFMNHTAVRNGGGFTSLRNANVVPPKVRDNMESFWLVSDELSRQSGVEMLNVLTYRPKLSSTSTSCSHPRISCLWIRLLSILRDTHCLGLIWDSCLPLDGRDSQGMPMVRLLTRLSKLTVTGRKRSCRIPKR
jgi:hypothetical protein